MSSESTEHTPLLSDYLRVHRSFYSKIVSLLEAEDEPSLLDSYRWFFLGSWLNFLLLLAPVAVAAHYLQWDAPLRFGFSFIAIIPLAKVCAVGLRSGLLRAYLNPFPVTWRCYRADFSLSWADSCWLAERYFRKCD